MKRSNLLSADFRLHLTPKSREAACLIYACSMQIPYHREGSVEILARGAVQVLTVHRSYQL